MAGVLRRLSQRLTRRSPGTVGLVLSGGGGAASFQVGALRYLYDVVGVVPSVVTGTSAGSILAALLAQADDHAGQRRMLMEAETLLHGLRSSADMFTVLPWYLELQKLSPALEKAAARRGVEQPRTLTLPALGQSPPETDAERDRDAAPKPIIRLPRLESSPVLNALSMLWEVGRSGADLDAVLRGARQERSLCDFGPLFDRLHDPAVLDPQRLRTSATALRIAVVGLESGELRYVRGDGVLVDREDRPVPGVDPIALADAVRASCAIPAVLPPVRLAGEHYVDGGTRENAPVHVAVDLLGVAQCYVVVALPKGLPEAPSFADGDMLSIVLRSTAGIMADELQLDEVAWARAAGAVVIAPEINVVDVLEADPGLLDIAADYGYVRAAEACEQATEEQQSLTRDVVQTRMQIWAWESERLGPDAATSPAVGAQGFSELGRLKRQLRDLVDQAPPHRLPVGAAHWWRTWEKHSFDIGKRPTWV